MLQKAKRLSVYRRMLKEYKTDTIDSYTGFCCVLNNTLVDMDIKRYFDNTHRISEFPELMMYKPRKPYGAYWWSTHTLNGLKKRILILEEIIANMSKKKK